MASWHLKERCWPGSEGSWNRQVFLTFNHSVHLKTSEGHTLLTISTCEIFRQPKQMSSRCFPTARMASRRREAVMGRRGMVGTFVCLFIKLDTYDAVSECTGKVYVRYSESRVCCCEASKKAKKHVCVFLCSMNTTFESQVV